MISRLNLLLLVALLFLTGCGGTLSISLDAAGLPSPANAATLQALETRIATLQPLLTPQVTQPSLTLSSDSESIRAALLDSHLNWQSLWVDATITGALPGGGAAGERVQFWVDQPGGRFRVLSGPAGGKPQVLQLADGAYQKRLNLEDLSEQVQPLMAGAASTGWHCPREVTDTIRPHPLDLEIDSPAAAALFPCVLAQRGGTYTPTALETVAGRSALVVEWSLDDATLRDRFWVDTRTGLILRWDHYAKQAPDSADVVTSVEIDALAYNASLPDSLFSLSVAEPPAYARDWSGRAAPTPRPPAAEFAPGEGELYFVVNAYPDNLQLVRLPGPCVLGEQDCPEPVVVEGFPNRQSTIHPLVWAPFSREGAALPRAALAQEGDLYVYDPGEETWKTLASFPVLASEPLWSPDGGLLVFTAQSADDRQDLYAVRPDGSGLQNLTNGQFHETPGILAPQGWAADGRLVFSHTAENTMHPYMLEIGEPRAALIPYRAFNNGIMAVSPDRQQMAYANLQNSTAEVYLSLLDKTDPQENPPRRVASFQQASVSQILWSPDGERLVFLVANSSGPSEVVYTIYDMRIDGSDLRVLFTQPEIGRLSFVGSRHLVTEGTRNGRLYLLALDSTAAPRLIHPPGLRLDHPLTAAAWKE